MDVPYWLDVPGDRPNVRGEPILRSGEFTDGPERVKLLALGGLHYIRGNSAPYFSLTVDRYRWERGKWEDDGGGAAHEEIVAHWPELAPLAALHLSTWDGVPMYATANGFYQLAGYGGGLGEQYHAGNAETYGGHGKETPEQVAERCLRQWADHVRLPLDQARTVADEILATGRAVAEERGWKVDDGVIWRNKALGVATRGAHTRWINAQLARWAREAEECCTALGIGYYYGDRLPVPVEAQS